MKATTTVDIFEKLIKDLQEAGQTDIFKNSVDSLKGLKGQVDATNKLMLEMGRAGDTRGAMRLIDAANRARESQVEATNNLIKAREKLSKINKEQDRAAYDAQLKVISRVNQEIDKLARQSVQMQKNAAEFTKGMDHSLLQYDNLLQSREDRYKELGKAGQVFEEKFANRFEGSVSAFTSGVADLESVGDTLKGGLEKFGSYLQERAGKAADLAKQGKGDVGAAKMLESFSKIAATTAVVAGSVMALIKLFNFVEGKVKDLNKNILQGHTGIELMAISGKDMATSLEIARQELGGMKGGQLANDMGILREDVMGLVNNLADMNMNLKYFGGNFDSLKGSMKQLKGFGEGLGIGFEGAAEYMEKFAVDMGVAAGEAGIISKMEQEFAAIRDMALQSSYSTKNFFNQVKDLTDSLQSMNNRSEEAGNLFNRFAKIVGPKGVGALLQGLAAGFRSESYLDLIKRQMLTKGKDISDALQVEANRTAKAFMDTYMGQLKAIDKDSEAGKQLQAMGITAKDMTPEKLVQILGKMSSADRQKLLGALSLDPKGAGAGRALDDLFDASRGARKGASRTDKSRAMRRAGGASAMALKFSAVQKALRKANISDASDLTLEAAKSFGLTNQEELDQFKQLQETMKGQLAIARDRVKREKGESDEAYAARMRSDENTQFLKQMGLAVKGGKLVLLDQQNQVVDSVSDMILASGAVEQDDDIGGIEQHQLTTEDYLAQQVTETQAISERINNHIGGILETMSDYLFGILNWTRDDDEAQATRQAVYERINRETKQERENLRTSRRNMTAYESQTQTERRSLVNSEEYKKANRATKRQMLSEFDQRRNTGKQRFIDEQDRAKRRMKMLRQAGRNLGNAEIDYTGYGQYNEQQVMDNIQGEAARQFARSGDYEMLSAESAARAKKMAALLKGTSFGTFAELTKAVTSGSLSARDREQLQKNGLLISFNGALLTEGHNFNTISQEQIAKAADYANTVAARGDDSAETLKNRQKVFAKNLEHMGARNRNTRYISSEGVTILAPDGTPMVGAGGRGQTGRRDIGVNLETAKLSLTEGLSVKNVGTAMGGATSEQDVYRRAAKDRMFKVRDGMTEMDLAEGLDQLAANVEPLSEAELRRRAKEDAKAAQSVQRTTTEEGVLAALQKHEDAQQLKQLQEVAAALQIDSTGKSKAELARLVGNEYLTDENRAALTALGAGGNKVAQYMAGSNAYGDYNPGNTSNYDSEESDEELNKGLNEEELPNNSDPTKVESVTPKDTNDLLITANGEVWRLNRQDRYTPLGGGFAFSKPGGEIDQYIGRRMSAGGRGGNTFDIDIVVNGAATNDETGRIIALKIKEAMRQYMGD